MENIVGITDLRANAKYLVDNLTPFQDVTIIRHAKPVALLVHPDRLEKLINRIEDLEDQLAVAQGGDAIPYAQARTELGLDEG